MVSVTDDQAPKPFHVSPCTDQAIANRLQIGNDVVMQSLVRLASALIEDSIALDAPTARWITGVGDLAMLVDLINPLRAKRGLRPISAADRDRMVRVPM